MLYTERRDSPAHRRVLGLLGDLARGNVLFEAFHNAPTTLELMTCVLKAGELHAREVRAARRARRQLSTVVVPRLCVIVPSMSPALALSAGAKPVRGKPRGLQALAPMLNTFIVVVNRLPRDASTLWLRLLGRGEVQAQAVRELAEETRHQPLRDDTIQQVVLWHVSLAGEHLSAEEQELAMNWELANERFEKKVKAGEAAAEARGEARATAKSVVVVLESRGFKLTAADRKQVLSCADSATLDSWLRAASSTVDVRTLLGRARRPAASRRPRSTAPAARR